MNFVRGHIGEAAFVLLIGLILASAGLAFFNFTIKHSSGFIKPSAAALILITGFALVWQIKVPAERINILEFAILGWFVGRDLIKKDKKIRMVILACIFSIFVGIIDEIFQAILPYRFFDVRDIIFNSMGGMWGVVLYLLVMVIGRENSFRLLK